MTEKKTGVRGSFGDRPLGEEYEGAEKKSMRFGLGLGEKASGKNPERYLKGTPSLILNICP